MKLAKSSLEALNLQTIKNAISPENITKACDILIFSQINSTNKYLLENASALSSGTVCLAEYQTQGRGRFSREWLSAPGEGIACSIVWKFKPQQDLHGLGLSVGLMVVQALQRAGIKDLKLKWPNDLFYQDKKLGGVLIENLIQPNEVQAVIGVGINLFSSKLEWISIADITSSIPPKNRLVGLLIDELVNGLTSYEAAGFAVFHRNWSDYDYLMQQEIKILNGKQVITGMMQGIDEQGKLILKKPDGACEKFSSGEVSVRLQKDLK